ncbi:MAG: maleylacetoacetate isomerase [Burkholderiales bacterium]|nr:maleylacetoacetate isomerase [Burkholderiales bacterium]GIK85437.1 MAG: maleylacetoacetate isomerase [Betaproteobacteria bacterium]
MKLFDYFRSSAAYRVRIALALKGLAPERTFVHLRHGAQRAGDYLALNPQGLVPALVADDGAVLTQSLAIVEWLDETHPQPPLLPSDADGRARVRSIAQAIACDIHPLNNLRVLNYLTGTLGVSEAQRDGWYRYWVDLGFEALERRLAGERATGRFCHGDAPTLADVCLVPQVANARRFAVDLAPYPTIVRIDAACAGVPAFAAAAPMRQPDAE